MRIRQLTFLKDRVRYALDKKLLNKIGWKDNDVIHQIPWSKQSISLFNETLNKKVGNEPGYKGILELISQRNLERQVKYEKIKKKYKNLKSRGFKRAMSIFNRGYLTEDEATGKSKISIKKLRDKLKIIELQINSLKSEKNWLKKDIKSRIKKKSSF